ncbi:hypothetical protein, partial [uncultured Nostoc sp.]
RIVSQNNRIVSQNNRIVSRNNCIVSRCINTNIVYEMVLSQRLSILLGLDFKHSQDLRKITKKFNLSKRHLDERLPPI